jgi:hypothetical protein
MRFLYKALGFETGITLVAYITPNTLNLAMDISQAFINAIRGLFSLKNLPV